MTQTARASGPFALAGVLAVGWMLSGTRWASYVGLAPVFLTDLLIAAAFVQHYVRRSAMASTRGDISVDRSTRSDIGFINLWLCWITFRFLIGFEPSVVALRDFAPYLYVALAVLSFSAVVRGQSASEVTSRIIFGSLALHAVWYTLVVLLPQVLTFMPHIRGSVSLLTPRPDIDSSLNGVLAALILVRLLTGRTRRRLLSISLLVWAIAGVLLGLSRAGLLGASSAILFALMAVLLSDRNRRRQLSLLAWLPLGLLMVALLLPSTTVGDRLGGTLGGSASTAARGAEGTTQARQAAWERVADYVAEDSYRLAVGVGFGPNFMSDSGATVMLLGNADADAENLRSPHNYWLGTVARLGMVGLLACLAVVGGSLRRAVNLRADALSNELLLVSVLLAVAILPSATFGVVLESPFGSVPYWWSIGVIYGYAHNRGYATTSDRVRSAETGPV